MWLTRDDDNTLSLHLNFPERYVVSGYVNYWSLDMINLPEDMFPEINTDSGPVEVDLRIKEMKSVWQQDLK